mgnify:CR=1 FL=1
MWCAYLTKSCSRQLHAFVVQHEDALFYLGLALLFTHELDAMPNHEWRVLPILRSLSDSAGEMAFLIAHVPIFAVAIAFIASLDVRTRSLARAIASGFLIVHAFLHYLFSGHSAYEFSSALSTILIFGAAVCGAGYFVAARFERRAKAG